MSITVDYKELRQFEKKLQSMGDNFELFLKDYCSEIANRLLRLTVKKTPRVTGNLADSWELGNVTNHGKIITVEMKNKMEYATEVEYGHRLVDGKGNEIRWVDGRFMLTTSIDLIERQIPLRYQKNLKQYFEKLGIKL